MSMLSIDDITGDLEVCKVTVRRWIDEGKLKAKKKNYRSGYLIELSDYEAFLDENPKYRRRHEGETAADWNARKSVCNEILVGMYELQKMFIAEEHGKVYSEGWNAAMERIDRMIKRILVQKIAD